jgi:hypothetical protein
VPAGYAALNQAAQAGKTGYITTWGGNGTGAVDRHLYPGAGGKSAQVTLACLVGLMANKHANCEVSVQEP